MKGLFSTDGPLFLFLMRLWDVLRLDLCLWLCCIPAILIVLVAAGLVTQVPSPLFFVLLFVGGGSAGAALSAAFTITLKMAENTEGYIFKPFFKAYITNAKKGFIIGMLNVLIIEAAYIDFQIFNSTEEGQILFLILGVIAAIVGVLCFLYAYALNAKYDNSIINILKNSASICIRYVLRTIILLLVLAVLSAVFMWNSTTIFLGLLFAPGAMCLTVSGIVNYIFKDIERRNANDDWGYFQRKNG